MSSVINNIATQLQTTLQTILTNNGYRTNAGNNVEFGYKVPEQVAKDRFPNIRINFPTGSLNHYTACEKQRLTDVEITVYSHGTEDENLFFDTHEVLEDILQLLSVNETLDGTVDTVSDMEIESFVLSPFSVSIITLKYDVSSLYKAISESFLTELGVDNVIVEL